MLMQDKLAATNFQGITGHIQYVYRPRLEPLGAAPVVRVLSCVLVVLCWEVPRGYRHNGSVPGWFARAGPGGHVERVANC